jgi:hypothetical protein
MQVGVKEEILSPTVEHGEEADFGAEMIGIGSDGRQGFGGGSEQDAVDNIFVLVSNGGDRFREAEDDMEIRSRENFRFSFFDPFGTRQGLALGAMSVAAAIVSVTLVRTAVAVLEMTTESCRAAHFDRGHDASLGRGERRTMLLAIGFTIAAEDVRHFQLGAIHGTQRLEERRRSGLHLQGNRVGQQIEWARGRAHFTGRDAEIFCCGGQAAMPKKQLNGANVGALLQ